MKKLVSLLLALALCLGLGGAALAAEDSSGISAFFGPDPEDAAEMVVGDWYLGKSGGYRYMLRLFDDGTFSYIQAKESAGIISGDNGSWSLEKAVTFQLDGTYTMDGDMLIRSYEREDIDPESSLGLPAQISFTDEGDTMWMYYEPLELMEYVTRLDEETVYAILLGVQDQEECPACGGEGVTRYKTEHAPNYTGGDPIEYEVPEFCPVCGGLGYVPA